MAISPYIAKLRERIGHDLLLMPSVCVLPKDASGRLLLVRESDSGRWGTIGGSIEPDERPEESAMREAKEEAGIDVELSLIAVHGGPEHIVYYSNGDVTQYISTVYEAQITAGEPVHDGDETLEVRWFAPHELDALDMSDFTRALLLDLGYLEGARR